MNKNNIFNSSDVVSIYTSDEATEDGILFDLSKSSFFKNEHFNFVTTNLLSDLNILSFSSKLNSDVINTPMLLDLLEQAKRIVLNKIRETLTEDTFYSGIVRSQDNQSIRIFICQNETGLFTLMLPSDY